MVVCFGHIGHEYKFFVIFRYIAFNDTFEHIRSIQPITSVFIYIDEQRLFAVIPDEDIVKMLPRPLSKQWGKHIRHSVFIEFNEVRVIHFGFMEGTVTGFYPNSYSGFAVIVTLPFVAVESRAPEQCINCVRVGAGAESNQSTERCVRFGL